MSIHATARTPRRIGGAVLAALITTLAAVLVSAPARADVPPQPVIVAPTTGWQADWHFTDSHHWTYNMGILEGAFMAGTGYDNSSLRSFTGTLTDTSASPDLCAYLTFAEPSASYTHVACNGSITFSHSDFSPSNYTFTLTLRNVSNMWRATSSMIVPSTQLHPELRASGNGAHWLYLSPTQASFGITRPGATLTGITTEVGTSRTASTTVVPNACTVTVLKDEGTELSDHEVCLASTTFTETGLHDDFEIRNCINTTVNSRPPAQLRLKCVPLIVR